MKVLCWYSKDAFKVDQGANPIMINDSEALTRIITYSDFPLHNILTVNLENQYEVDTKVLN